MVVGVSSSRPRWFEIGASLMTVYSIRIGRSWVTIRSSSAADPGGFTSRTIPSPFGSAGSSPASSVLTVPGQSSEKRSVR